jgi:hypothetical protein
MERQESKKAKGGYSHGAFKNWGARRRGQAEDRGVKQRGVVSKKDVVR